ncbi:EAL domain-containing protein [uncultured Massilia sp.]|uniref:EAL domain-containing response regulator n=1 Tax=uncultured Massilia sp. TaxID=169973 RepID=UPI0025D6A1A2|nr:EAL domain-containing response regulator [uncultured Massilia sp.]
MSTSSAAPAGAGVIHAIVLDADGSAREHTIAACRRLGIRISGAADNGCAGLELLETLPRTPELTIVDLRLADMDGADLMQALALLAPSTNLVICSAGEPRLLDAACTLAQELGLAVLGAAPKPVQPEALQRALGLLARARRAPVAGVRPALDGADVMRALRRHEFELHYQPKVALDGMRPRGAEALLRWRHPVHGLLGPCAFLAQVREADLFAPLTLEVLELAQADWRDWQARGAALPLSINLPAGLLGNPSLAARLIASTEAAGVPASAITFELTEDTEMADLAVALRVLIKLRLHGFGLSLDDYGVGFSSIQRLSRIPFTELKIDRSLVHEAWTRPHLLPLLKSTIDLAEGLGIEAVAEGVEQEADLDLLRRLGCHQAQGFYLARPMPAADLERLLGQWAGMGRW